MDFNKKYKKTDVSIVVGATRDQVNQWAKLSKSFSPIQKRGKGKGRPLDVYSIVDLYRFAVFKELSKKIGLSRKSSESLISSVKQEHIDTLILLSKSNKIDKHFEEIAGLWHFYFIVDGPSPPGLSLEFKKRDKIIKNISKEKLKNKINKMRPPGIPYLIFTGLGEKTARCIPAVKSPGLLFDDHSIPRLHQIIEYLEDVENVLLLNLGKIMGEVNFNIRYILSQSKNDYWEWLDSLVGDEILDSLLG